MVKIATSLCRSGLQDWLIQRITAVILSIYTVFLLGYLVYYPSFQFESWRYLFTSFWIQYATFLALLSLVMHAWVGVWTVITDYVKPVVVRLVVQLAVIFSLLLYLIWGIQIIWGL